MRAETKQFVYEDLDMMVEISFFLSINTFNLMWCVPMKCRHYRIIFKENRLVHVVRPSLDSV